MGNKITLEQINEMRQNALARKLGGKELRRLKTMEKFIKMRDDSNAQIKKS